MVIAHHFYSSPDVVVRSELFPGNTAFVTFQSASHTPGFHRQGFGDSFFSKRGIPAIHFVPSDNLWYQSEDVVEAVMLAREALRPYSRVITYGASMGGYAALNFARLLDATESIAISPQFSINPKYVPFETRYTAAQNSIRAYVFDKVAALKTSDVRSYVLFDPRNRLDNEHAQLINNVGGNLVGLGYSSHPITSVLPTESLKQFLLNGVNDSIDKAVPDLVGSYRVSRKQSSAYWLFLAKQNPNASLSKRIRLVQTALSFDQQNADAHLLLANLVIRENPHLSLIHCQRSIEGKSDFWPGYLTLAKCHLALKQFDKAEIATEELERIAPNRVETARMRAMIETAKKRGTKV